MADTIEVPLEFVVDLQWMARRYCDGRMSYAPSLFNDITRWLLDNGVELNQAGDPSVFARDGMGADYDKLTDEEAGNRDEAINMVRYP